MNKFYLVVAVIYITLGVGWCMNVYKFCTLDFESPYKAEVVRGVTIFLAPVGGVVGYITFGEEESE